MRISKEKQEETKRLYELENAIMRLKKEKDAGLYDDYKKYSTFPVLKVK